YFALDQYDVIKNSKLIYSIQGLMGFLTINTNKTVLFANIKLQHLFANIDTPREISDFSAVYRQSKNKFDFWTGQNIYHFGSLKWQQGERLFLFKKFDYALNNQVHGDHLNATLNTTIQSAQLNNVDYGRQKISLTLTDLNIEAFKKFQQSSPFS